jgi:hypothetical protein
MGQANKPDVARDDMIPLLSMLGVRIGKALICIVMFWFVVSLGLGGFHHVHVSASRMLGSFSGVSDPLNAESAPGIPVEPIRAAAEVNTMAESTTAEQMAAAWARDALGERSANGFYLVTGPGSPGDNCNANGGLHLLQFGARVGGEQGLPIADYFSGTFKDTGWGVMGAFWYDNQTHVLATKRMMAHQLEGDVTKDLPDDDLPVQLVAAGIVLIDRVRFHLCSLRRDV